MPFYSYRCDSCDHSFDVRKPMSESDTEESCPECRGETKKLVVPVGHVLKGDDWASKNNRVSGQMRKNRDAAGRRQEERVRDGALPGGKLVPNVGGERVETWTDAAKLAKDKGKDTTGYERMAVDEKATAKKTNSKTS